MKNREGVSNLLQQEYVASVERWYLARDSVCFAHCGRAYAGEHMGHDDVLHEALADLDDIQIHGCCIVERIAHHRQSTFPELPSCQIHINFLPPRNAFEF